MLIKKLIKNIGVKNMLIREIACPFFVGFHDNSYYMEIETDDNYYPDTDYTALHKDVSIFFVDKIKSILQESTDRIKIKFKSVYSPKYYNYETEQIICSVYMPDSGFELLKEEIINNKEEFIELIEKRFTSRDGFSSFYSNSYDVWLDKYINNFKSNKLEEQEIILKTMLEFYLLCNTTYDITDYLQQECCCNFSEECY
jgi:hypothetical protein